MCFSTILRHEGHLGVIGWMMNTSVSTQSRLFVAWSVFLVADFESIDFTPLPGELAANLAKDFNDADLETHHAWVIVQRLRLLLQETLM